MSLVEVKVPDIGDFKDVPIITVFVKPGDVVKPEDPLITLESDKASMDVPAPAAGTVKELKVKVGDRVGEGALVLLLEVAAAAAPRAAAPAACRAGAGHGRPTPGEGPGPPRLARPTPARWTSPARCWCWAADPAATAPPSAPPTSASRRCWSSAMPSWAGVCLNVGCIPSKALLHVAAVMDEVKALAAHGVSFGAPTVDLAGLKAWKSKVVAKLTGGLQGMARARKVEVLRGYGSLLDAHHLEVEKMEGQGQTKTGQKAVVRFEQLILANGSQAVRLPFLPADPRILDSTSALELPVAPKRMLIIGGGIIGLELGTVYSTLGARLDVVEMLDGLMQGADRDLVKVWEKHNRPRFDQVMLRTKTVGVEARPDGLHVTFEGEAAPKGPQLYDAVLVAVGRSPNGKKVGAERAGWR